MNEQPEAAAKAAKRAEQRAHFDKIAHELNDSSPECLSALDQLYIMNLQDEVSQRDEQIAALTDKLATVTAEREAQTGQLTEALQAIGITGAGVMSSDVVDMMCRQLSANAATIEGLKRERDAAVALNQLYHRTRQEHRDFAKNAQEQRNDWQAEAQRLEAELSALTVYADTWKTKARETENQLQGELVNHAKELSALRTRVAELEREKKEEAESYAAVIRINGSQHETIRDGLYRKLDALRAEAARIADDYIADSVETAPLALREMREAISALATQNPTT